MEKKSSSLKNMLISLLCVGVFSGACVGGMYVLTQKKIAEAEATKQKEAIEKVLPAFSRTAEITLSCADAPNGSLKAFAAYDEQDQLVGTAVETFTKKGFGGEVRLMVGFLPDGSFNKIEVLQHAETPGLGSKMSDPKFATQFEKQHPQTFNLSVKKDGGDVDAITAATISSRAYCDALNRAYNALVEGGAYE